MIDCEMHITDPGAIELSQPHRRIFA